MIKIEVETKNNGSKNVICGLSVTKYFTTEYPNPKEGNRIIKKPAAIFILARIVVADFIIFDFLDYGS